MAALEEGNNAYLLQSEYYCFLWLIHRAYKLLFENIKNKDDKLSEDTLREISEVIEQAGGTSEFTMTNEEIKEIRKEKKEGLKKKKKISLIPLDEDDWRG